MDNYNRPILCGLFIAFGWLNIVGAVFAFVGAMTIFGQVTTSGFAIFLPCVAAAFSALVCFGISQAIDYVGQIAHYTRLSYERSTGQAVLTAGTIPATQQVTSGAVPPSNASALAKPLSAVRYYYLDKGSQPAGPVSKAELSRFLASDALVCAEGTEQWVKFGDLASV